MGHKKYKERRLPSFHKGDPIAHNAAWHDEWWDTKPIDNHKSWKKHRKTQYRHIPHFDLFEPFERDECGIVITDGQVDDMHYLLTHYEFSAVAGLVYA